ncbi:MAG TPA: putative glycoside hydrolase [Ardenticatenaceae bacterium]|nr:putative glycoside hydrolase [Ardenticatenaceae bacterium]
MKRHLPSVALLLFGLLLALAGTTSRAGASSPEQTQIILPDFFGGGPAESDRDASGGGAPSSLVQLAWFNNPPADGNLEPLTHKFGSFILGRQYDEMRDSLRAEGVKSPFLMYMRFEAIHDPGSCDATPRRNQVADQPGDFCRISAEHPDWFMLDEAGNRIMVDEGGLHYYMMDPGNPGWRAFWLERARAELEASSWDGVSLDNVEASRSAYRKRGAMPAAYPDDASFQAAVQGFLVYMYQSYFQPRGLRLQANVTAVADEAVWFNYMQYLDGAMEEGWAVDWHDGYLSPRQWENHVSRVEQTQTLGKNVIVVSQGAQSDQNRHDFAFASYLLAASGRASFRYSDASSYRTVWLYDTYNADLGQPLGPRYQVGDEWRRDFANGSVSVNPVAHTARISVGQLQQG